MNAGFTDYQSEYRSLNISLKIGFHPFIRGLSAATLRIWYFSLFANPRCRYQPSRANPKISYKVGNWHASSPLRSETAAAVPNYRLQHNHGPFGYWSELVFPPSSSKRPKRAPLQGTPRRGSAFSVGVVKYWNKLQASVVTVPSVEVFKKRLEKVWTEVFPYLSHWLNTHLPISLPPPPIPPAHLPLTVIISVCYPNSLLYLCGFFRPVVAYFSPLEIIIIIK